MTPLALLLCLLPTAPPLRAEIARTWTIDLTTDVTVRVGSALGFEVNKGDKLVITEDTDVRLDGRRCKFSDVPTVGVEITDLDVATDRRTVLRIYFRSVK